MSSGAWVEGWHLGLWMAQIGRNLTDVFDGFSQENAIAIHYLRSNLSRFSTVAASNLSNGHQSHRIGTLRSNQSKKLPDHMIFFGEHSETPTAVRGVITMNGTIWAGQSSSDGPHYEQDRSRPKAQSRWHSQLLLP